MAKTALMALVVAALMVGSANAILILDGAITGQTLPDPPAGGHSSALGSAASPISFDLKLNVPPAAGPAGTIIAPGSSLTFASGGSFHVIDGTISVTDDGVNDVVSFAVNVDNMTGDTGAADGQITFSFLGDLVSSTTIDERMLDGLVVASSSINYIDFSNSQLSSYNGVVAVTASVPEVSPMLGLAVAGLGMIGWRSRKRIWN